MKDIKETFEFVHLNFKVVRDLIIINLPTATELEELNVSKSGLITSFGDKTKDKTPTHNQYIYTVLGVGPDVTDIEVGDKIHVKPGIDAFMIEDFTMGCISRFQVIMIKK